MRRILLLPIAALVLTMFTVAPASAATVETFTLDGSTEDTTAVVGQTGSIQGTVSSEGAFAVFAEGTAADNPGVDGWSGQVSPDGVTDDGFGANFTFLAPGTYTFSVRVTESGEPEGFSDTITVTVLPGEQDAGVVPAPVTFPDACTVTVPTTEGVRYVVDFGDGDVEDAFPGTLPVVAYYNDEAAITFRAEPLAGVTLDPAATTEWITTPAAECFGQEADLVSTAVSCGAVRFTNTTDRTVALFYGDPDEDEAEPGNREIAPGGSTVVRTELDELFFVASAEADNTAGFEFDFDELEVPQDCTPASDGAAHPTVAPAAGAGQASSAGATGALAVAALLGAGLLGARRLRDAA